MKHAGAYFLTKVISGGQTGADQAGLLAAEAAGVPTGGWAPKGWRTDIGAAPWLGTRFGLREHSSPRYPPRTEANVAEATGTLILGRVDSAGTRLTLRLCQQWHRPALVVPWPDLSTTAVAARARIEAWLVAQRIEVLNVAGNREDTNPGICLAGVQLLTPVFRGLACTEPTWTGP